jgi:S1-C subfamily serine protease
MRWKALQCVLALLLVVAFGCAPNDLTGGRSFAAGRSFSGIFQQVNPSVVKILALRQTDAAGRESRVQGEVGSGVIVSQEGLIMTAAHSVNIADKVVVKLLDDRTFEAEVVAASGEADIALLALDHVPDSLQAAKLGDSEEVAVGDQVLVIGAPYGIEHTLSVGHISGKRRSRTVCEQFAPFEFLQTDAAINRGNSGGPMFDTEGRVVGIVSRILSKSGGSEGLGFAVAINTARELLLDREAYWIGFDAHLLTGDLAKAFNLPQDAGLLVQHVAAGSPGARLGLQPGSIPVTIGNEELLIGGDVVLQIQSIPVSAKAEEICVLQNVVGGFSREKEIRVTVFRKGEVVHLSTGR